MQVTSQLETVTDRTCRVPSVDGKLASGRRGLAGV